MDGDRFDARQHLGAAQDLFERFGAEAFAERARRELLATGETARRRTADTLSVLTPQEAQIARLARDGLTNPEIGAQLFLSPRTVEYHLHKVFPKLDISSRTELRHAPGQGPWSRHRGTRLGRSTDPIIPTPRHAEHTPTDPTRASVGTVRSERRKT